MRGLNAELLLQMVLQTQKACPRIQPKHAVRAKSPEACGGHPIFPYGYLRNMRGVPPLLMWLCPAGPVIQHCHLLTSLFHYRSDKLGPSKIPHSINQQFIFKDFWIFIYFFKKAKGRISQSGYFFRGPYFIFHLLSCHGGANFENLHRNLT